MKLIFKALEPLAEKQIEWFGSDKFMWLVFGSFFAGMGLLIALN
jgi:hypothetical protein